MARQWVRAQGLVVALTVTASLSLGAAAQAPESWKVAGGTVVINCPFTVGGSFDAKGTAIQGQLSTDAAQPAALTGELSVDLSSLDTGIDLRNTHFRERYLEVGKGPGFDKAVLKNIVLDRGPVSQVKGAVRFTASLTVHGVTKSVSGDATLQPSTAGVRVEATFPVHLPDFDIAKPRYLGVGVKDDVRVRVAFEAGRQTGGR
jgi:polyisoprenoid-binding protein YceI